MHKRVKPGGDLDSESETVQRELRVHVEVAVKVGSWCRQNFFYKFGKEKETRPTPVYYRVFGIDFQTMIYPSTYTLNSYGNSRCGITELIPTMTTLILS